MPEGVLSEEGLPSGDEKEEEMKQLNLCILCAEQFKEGYKLARILTEPSFFDKCDGCRKKRQLTPYSVEVKRRG